MKEAENGLSLPAAKETEKDGREELKIALQDAYEAISEFMTTVTEADPPTPISEISGTILSKIIVARKQIRKAMTKAMK